MKYKMVFIDFKDREQEMEFSSDNIIEARQIMNSTFLIKRIVSIKAID